MSEFKNLRDFSISFDADSSVSVLVGRNGAGKSNILEALTLIFRDLDLGQVASLSFKIRYQCRGHEVVVVGTSGERTYAVTVDGAAVSASRLLGESGRDLRPDFVFGYYSGPSNRFEQHFTQHQERFYRDLVSGIENPLRPLFYARAVHSNFVLLAFFLENDSEVRNLLRDHLGIESLDSVLFEMQKPTWKSSNGDPRFWNAQGTVRTFLDGLYRLALAPMRMDSRIKVGTRRPTKNEHLYLFLPGLSEVQQLRSAYRSNQEFFKALESTYISELIYDVRIRVSLKKVGAPLTFRELSEGEQQLLLVLGLMRFTREDESLFLLDEPDTHLNPAWSAQYRRFLERFGGLGPTSHVLMATHDPLVVSALKREEVRILERGTDGLIHPIEPLEDPQGMGVGNLLTSDVYGLKAQVDIETLEKIQLKRSLAARNDLSADEESKLAGLAEELRHLGLLTEDRDPDFQEYLKVKYAEREVQAPKAEPRTQADIQAERALAERIFSEVVAKRGQVEAENGEDDLG
ncbi:AAA family ATPase [Lentzea sp. NPDC058436]|uniref:AAA family ATPase n=1 Tax=Lentzea sp. NPDC058436 TaxID=3346499 RepID=UPI00365D1EC1